MSEEQDESKVVDVIKTKDANIEHFAYLSSGLGFEISLTLFVKGQVITGKTISGKNYYESIAKPYGPYVENNPSLGDYFRAFSKSFYEPKENEEFDPPANFLHLKDVAILKGDGSFIKFKGGLLRIKIEEIDGHILGIATHE